jgi:ABC-type sugar transport system substrate-binding protein
MAACDDSGGSSGGGSRRSSGGNSDTGGTGGGGEAPLKFQQTIGSNLVEIVISRPPASTSILASVSSNQMGNISSSVLSPRTGDFYVIRLNSNIISRGTINYSSGTLTFRPSSDSPCPKNNFNGTLSDSGLNIPSMPSSGGNTLEFSGKRVNIRIGFSQNEAGTNNNWKKAQTKSIQDAFGTAGFELTTSFANFDANLQRTHVQGFINSGVDYIIINAVDSGGWNTVLTNARNAGIKVIFVDNAFNANDNLWASFVTYNAHTQGLRAAEWVEKHFGKTPINIVHIGGHANWCRTKGINDVRTRNNSWTLLEYATTDWERKTARDLMTAWINKHGTNIDVVFAESDNMAAGAIEALLNASASGIQIYNGSNTGVVIATFDGSKESLQQMLNHKRPHVNVEVNPLIGPFVRQVIDRLERGETPNRHVDIVDHVFTYNTITAAQVNARQH